MQAILFTKKFDSEPYGEPQTWECDHPPVPGDLIQQGECCYRVKTVFVNTTPGETSVYAVETKP